MRLVMQAKPILQFLNRYLPLAVAVLVSRGARGQCRAIILSFLVAILIIKP
jgi:hypothetical protein